MTFTRTCAFETTRLLVQEWRSPSNKDWQQPHLTEIVTAMLTPPVTQSLPTPWQGVYSLERAQAWIDERDDEGTTLLVINKRFCQAIGLMILFEIDAEDDEGGLELRIGYLLAESAWGQGFASELIEGFVGWCHTKPAISKLAGGVERDNPASRRVLEKNGFQPVQDEGRQSQAEQIYELVLHPGAL